MLIYSVSTSFAKCLHTINRLCGGVYRCRRFRTSVVVVPCAHQFVITDVTRSFLVYTHGKLKSPQRPNCLHRLTLPPFATKRTHTPTVEHEPCCAGYILHSTVSTLRVKPLDASASTSLVTGCMQQHVVEARERTCNQGGSLETMCWKPRFS